MKLKGIIIILLIILIVDIIIFLMATGVVSLEDYFNSDGASEIKSGNRYHAPVFPEGTYDRLKNFIKRIYGLD